MDGADVIGLADRIVGALPGRLNIALHQKNFMVGEKWEVLWTRKWIFDLSSSLLIEKLYTPALCRTIVLGRLLFFNIWSARPALYFNFLHLFCIPILIYRFVYSKYIT